MTKNRIVFSTDSGRVDKTQTDPSPPPTDGIVRIRRESKGRGGKPVCVISGLGLDSAELKVLSKALKKRCGVGGAIKDWDILIQGDHRELLKTELEARGYTVKLAGG
ncbi:MAG: translation initiation factor [Gammaproteobacteria bacterium]